MTFGARAAAAVLAAVLTAAGCRPHHPRMDRPVEPLPATDAFRLNPLPLTPPWMDRQRNTDSPGDARDSQPTVWADDADRLLVYVSTRQSSNPKLFLKEAAGTWVRQLTYGLSSEGFPRFSPDGKHIAFASTRDGNGEIYVMNADGSGHTNLTANPAYDWWPAWSPKWE
jgi:hypothetical protein